MNQKNNRSISDGVDSLKELGEFGLIERIARLFGSSSDDRITGIGDDCAVLPSDSGDSLLVTTDMLIEERHFRLDWISAENLGYKSLAVNVSDISAMGGKPEHAFLSIGLPEHVSPDWLERFFRETHNLCKTHRVSLLGGDTTKSPGPMVINYVVLGRTRQDQTLMRSDARPNDRIALLGNVGESGCGFKLLSEGIISENRSHRHVVDTHNRPPLFVEEAQYLAGFPGVHAMIDLSDGLRSDAGHIAKRSAVTLRIEIQKLPLSRELKDVCEEFSWNIYDLALTAGEDYGLLFTADPSELDEISESFENKFGYRFAIIGEVFEGKSEIQFTSDGKPLHIEKGGFDHFRSD